MTAGCGAGSCKTELIGSAKYQRQEKPCHALCDLPLLNENSTAIAIGTNDQIRYSQVKPSSSQGWRHGLLRGRNRLSAPRPWVSERSMVGAVALAVTPPPATSGSSPPRSRPSERPRPAATTRKGPRPRPAGL